MKNNKCTVYYAKNILNNSNHMQCSIFTDNSEG